MIPDHHTVAALSAARHDSLLAEAMEWRLAKQAPCHPKEGRGYGQASRRCDGRWRLRAVAQLARAFSHSIGSTKARP